MQLHLGSTLERPPQPRYFTSGLSLLELSPRGPMLRPGTMAKWRAEIPKSARLAFVLPKEAWLAPRGALRFDDQVPFQWIDTLSAQLAPQLLVLATGAELSPSPRDRELLAKYVERAQKGGAGIVWQPGGVWEGEAAHELGRSLGIQVTWDPIEEPLLSPGKTAYVRLRAIGMRSRLGEGLLLQVAERVLASGADEASIAIDSPVAIKKARALLALIAGELGAAAPSDDEDDEADEADDDGTEDGDE